MRLCIYNEVVCPADIDPPSQPSQASILLLLRLTIAVSDELVLTTQDRNLEARSKAHHLSPWQSSNRPLSKLLSTPRFLAAFCVQRIAMVSLPHHDNPLARPRLQLNYLFISSSLQQLRLTSFSFLQLYQKFRHPLR